jgi:hypothetical protein
MDVILRDDMVEKVRPGDKCIFVGTLIAIPEPGALAVGGKLESRRGTENVGRGRDNGLAAGVTGLKALGARELSYKLAFVASSVQQADMLPRHEEFYASVLAEEAFHNQEEKRQKLLDSMTPEELDHLKTMVQQPHHIYGKLVKSLAPSVFGHDEIKRGILLQLIGGVHKTTAEGIGLRGDINICIVGDPSTSKSQFLRYVCGLVPRAVFTSGKASTAAGLTAAVVKDEETGEFTIEAGALMLADNVPPLYVVDGCRAFVPLTSLIRWTVRIRWPSTKPWNSKPSLSLKQASTRHSMPARASLPLPIPSADATTNASPSKHHLSLCLKCVAKRQHVRSHHVTFRPLLCRAGRMQRNNRLQHCSPHCQRPSLTPRSHPSRIHHRPTPSLHSIRTHLSPQAIARVA